MNGEGIIEEEPKWLVMIDYKSEKTAEDMLCGNDGLEYFVPKRYVARKYQGKMKRVIVPVIPNLVFVHAR